MKQEYFSRVRYRDDEGVGVPFISLVVDYTVQSGLVACEVVECYLKARSYCHQ